MALEAQKAVVQFRGLETKVDDKQAVAGDLVLLENVIFDTTQEFRKRNGYARLAKASAGNGKMLANFKKELLLADGRNLLGYTSGGLVDKGVYEPLNVEVQSVAKNNYTQQMPDSVWHPNGVSVFAWESVESGVTVSRYTVFDNETKQPLFSNRLIGAQATRPKVIAFGDFVYIFYVEAPVASLRYIRLLAVNPANTPVEGTLAGGVASTGLFDACIATRSTSQIYVVYASMDGNVYGMRVTAAGDHVAAVSLVTASPDALTVFERGQAGAWIAYGAGGTSGSLYAMNFDASFGTPSSLFTIEANVGTVKNVTGIGVGPTAVSAGASGFFFYECWDAYSGRVVRRAYSGEVSGVISYGALVRLVGLAAKVFQVDGPLDFRLLLTHESSLQSTYFLAKTSYWYSTGFSYPVVVAKLASGTGGGYTKKPGLGEVTAHVGTWEYSFAYLQTDRLVSTAGGIRTQTGVQGATITWDASRESLEMGDTLLLTGGILSAYDGVAVAEHGFHLYPEGLIASGQPNSIVAGDPTQTGAEAGSYQTCAIFEWMDNFGLLHQSAASPTVTVNALAGQMFSYQVPTYTLGNKGSPVSIVLFRTLVNASVFFRVTSVSAPLLNDPTLPWVRFTEAIPDTLLSANAQLVSNPLNSLAEVAALAVDAPRFIARYRNRAITIPAEAPGQWQYSKAVIPGVPTEFNSQQFYNPVQGGGVPLNCAIEMDDKLILFADDRIYWTAGDGPAPNGTGNDYGNAFRVPADVGCPNPRSLVLTPSGVFFQSSKGIYLLGRDLSVQYVGAPVERYNELTVTAALIVPNSRRVVFTMARSEPNVNMALVYDYFVQKWAVWTQYGATDATTFEGKLTHLDEFGSLYQETPKSFSDAGSRILIKFKTSWLSFAGLSGYQRVWRFILRGSYRGAHKLLISVAFNDSPAAEQNVEVNAQTALAPMPLADTSVAGEDDPGGGKFANYEWQVKLLRQKTTSIQVTVTEAPLDNPNEGLSVSVLTFLVGVLPKLKKVGRGHNLTPGTPTAAPAPVVGGGEGV